MPQVMGQGLRLACSCPPKLRAGTPAPQQRTFPARPPASSAGLSSGMAVCGTLIPAATAGCTKTGSREAPRQGCLPRTARRTPPSFRKPQTAPAHIHPTPHRARRPWLQLDLYQANPCLSPPSEGAPHSVPRAAEGQGWGQGDRLTQPSGPRRLPGRGSADLRPEG